jgi:hypothetical protein
MGRSVRLVSFCAAAVAVLGVTAVAEAATPVPKAMVLRLSDLPTSFAVTDKGVLTNAQEAKQKRPAGVALHETRTRERI